MREILFRGKRVDNGEWVEGDLVHDAYDGSSRLMNVGIRYRWAGSMCYPAEVIPETVGQFTGILDKNGKKIFEGDIVSVNGRKRVGIYNTEVIWDRMGFTLKENNTYIVNGRSLIAVIEVVCNIHDSPNNFPIH